MSEAEGFSGELQVGSEAWVSVYRKRAAMLTFVLAFAGGVTAGKGAGAHAFSVMSFASALVLWCVLDARMHQKDFLRSYGWLMMFTWPVGMLAYLLWTRGVGAIVLYFIYALMFLFCAGMGVAFAGALGHG